MDRAISAFDRCGLVRHGDQAARISHHHAVEGVIGNEHIGASADNDQRKSFGIGVLHGLDQSDARGRLDEVGDMSAHTHGGDVCKACHGFLS